MPRQLSNFYRRRRTVPLSQGSFIGSKVEELGTGREIETYDEFVAKFLDPPPEPLEHFPEGALLLPGRDFHQAWACNGTRVGSEVDRRADTAQDGTFGRLWAGLGIKVDGRPGGVEDRDAAVGVLDHGPLERAPGVDGEGAEAAGEDSRGEHGSADPGVSRDDREGFERGEVRARVGLLRQLDGRGGSAWANWLVRTEGRVDRNGAGRIDGIGRVEGIVRFIKRQNLACNNFAASVDVDDRCEGDSEERG